MSYRTKVNGFEIFGNNECYKEWLEYIQNQGIVVKEDGSYKGELIDFMGALVVIEHITLRLNKQRELVNSKSNLYKSKNLFDWSDIPSKLEEQDKEDKYGISLFDKLMEIVNNGYAFLPYTFYLACEDKLERTTSFST
ncbi:MAG: hypothetical protein IJZ36_02895, partial [Bacilli bacterium]|nr:hypothetical protein [Bacilli bacterium]